MLGINHIGLALAVSAIAGPPVGIEQWAALTVGSILPDIDGHGMITKPGKYLPIPIVGFLLNHFMGCQSWLIKKVLGHRGPVHWPLWALPMLYFGYFGHWPVLWWLGIGFLLHILGDTLTVQGIPILGPISQQKYGFRLFYTGGKVEWLIGTALWLIFLGWAIAQLGNLSTLPKFPYL